MDFMGLLGFYARLRWGVEVRLCEQDFLTIIGLFFTSLTRVKEVKRRKRVQGDSKSPCRSPGLCALCTCGPNAFREAASLLSLGTERISNPVGRGLAPAVAPCYSLVRKERQTL